MLLETVQLHVGRSDTLVVRDGLGRGVSQKNVDKHNKKRYDGNQLNDSSQQNLS